MKRNKNIILLFILLLATILRLYGSNWDLGFHLHPDERMLVMVTEKINFFQNLNPGFFNYGSFPIYLLRIFSPHGDYQSLLPMGRYLSILFDIITITLIFHISQLLFKNSKLSLVSAILYAIAFFPIQNSHFFVVDVFLTTFTTLLVYLLLLYFKSPSKTKIVLLSVTFAAMLATKFTAIIFYPFIIGVIFWKSKKQFKNLIIDLFIYHLSFVICHFVFMPYAYLNFPKFLTDIKLQLSMNSNPYIFPYTLQYVATTPYFYYLKNIFIWGLGPFISILSLIGIVNILKFLFSNFKILFKSKKAEIYYSFIFLFFYFFYFLIVGRSSVKFMRYMLPLYPFLTILAGYGLYKLYKSIKILSYVFFIAALIWTYMFLNIFSSIHTRIAASEWMLKNIPSGSTLAVEHWDDQLPIYGQERFNFQQLTFYDLPDDSIKWKTINDKLKMSDYIIIASNRLYVPLQKLSDCNKFSHCYPLTSNYYKKLFGNRLNFHKIAEFKVYPALKIGSWKLEIKDDSADESFTVYDHPRIMIFKKI